MKTLKNELLVLINFIRIKELKRNPKLVRQLRRLNRQTSPRLENDPLAILGYLDRDFMLTNNFNNLPCGEIK